MKIQPLLKAGLLLVIISLLFTACKKDKSKNGCTIIAELQVSAGSTNTLVNKVTYNGDGTLSYQTDDARVITWHYPGTVTIMGSSGSAWFRKTITVNEYGMLTNFRTDFDDSGNNWEINNYEYQNGVQLISSATTTPHQFPATFAYTWSAGNLITRIYQGPGQFKQTYSYAGNRSSVAGDYFTHLDISLAEGFRVFGSKNLSVSVDSDGAISSFSYQAGNDGKIRSMKISPASGDPITIQYTYQCSDDQNLK